MNLITLEYGPLLHAAVGDSHMELDRMRGPEELVKSLEPMGDAPLHYKLRGHAGITFVPYYAIREEKFTCFPAIPAARG